MCREFPTAPGYWSEEPGESVHKIERFRREHHARKMDVDSNLTDIAVMQYCSADPVILKILEQSTLAKRVKKERLPGIEALLVDSETEDDEAMETESEGQSESCDDIELSDLEVPFDPDSDIESDHEFDREFFASSDNESDESDHESDYESD